MISSMQKNKKWLLPTIWISTIAFVGAGFVGWGSYNPSTSGSNMATVGTKEISIKALQNEYSSLYSQYQEAFGKQFNKELAEQLKLEQTAYTNLIQRYLLLNLSEDIGFIVSDKEVYSELLQVKSFLKDGKFDNDLYKNILKQNRTTPNEFEKRIRIDLKLRKIQNVYSANINKNTLENINKLFFSTDKISINIINNDDIKVSATANELKKYYESNKNNYMSNTTYKVNIEKIDIKKDEKTAKKTALRKYLKLKKSTEKFTNTSIIDSKTIVLNEEQKDLLFSSSVDTVLKPMRIENEFVIYQLIKVIKPQPLAISKITTKLNGDFKVFKTAEIIKEKTTNLISNFTGKEIGYVSKESIIKIDGLSEQEVSELIKKVTTSINKIDSVNLGNKTVVFNILDTKLASYDSSKDKYLEDTIKQLKDSETMASIIKNIESKYEVISNYKVK